MKSALRTKLDRIIALLLTLTLLDSLVHDYKKSSGIFKSNFDFSGSLLHVAATLFIAFMIWHISKGTRSAKTLALGIYAFSIYSVISWLAKCQNLRIGTSPLTYYYIATNAVVVLATVGLCVSLWMQFKEPVIHHEPALPDSVRINVGE